MKKKNRNGPMMDGGFQKSGKGIETQLLDETLLLLPHI